MSKLKLRYVFAIIFWLIVWQILAIVISNPLLVPSVKEVVFALIQLVQTSIFWVIIWSSAFNILTGFIAAFILGCALGALANRFEWVKVLLAPIMNLFKSTPVACIVVLLLVWVGSLRTVGIAVALVVLPAYYFSMLQALSSSDRSLTDLLRIMGVRVSSRVLAGVWPNVESYIEATSVSVVGMAWKAGVAAQLIGCAFGTIGEQIYQSKLLLETANLFAWTIAVILCAFLCERLFIYLLHASVVVACNLAVSLAVKFHGEPCNDDSDRSDLICIKNLTIERGGKVLFRNLSCNIVAGEKHCLMAPSGAGKTTLLNSICGLYSDFQNGWIDSPNVMGVMSQETRLVEQLSAIKNIELVAGRINSCELEVLLKGVDLNKPVSELSGGERRRAELARAMYAPGDFMLLDEPFSGLDEKSHKVAAAFVLQHLKGCGLLVATHDPLDATLLSCSYSYIGTASK